MKQLSRDFYEHEYLGSEYSSTLIPEDHSYYQELLAFVHENNLQGKKCLEVGTGRGAFKRIVDDYTGIDIAFVSSRFLDNEKFIVANAVNLPFPSNYYDGVWSITVFEHIIDPEFAMEEIWRVLKPGGLLFFAPAWHCRSWAAEGYPVRPYSDFDIKGKFIKASIPIRNNILFRSVPEFFQRINLLIRYLTESSELDFHYKKLTPNYKIYWMSDSDAVNSMDPFAAYVWFRSRGGICLNYPNINQAFVIRNSPLIFQKFS